MRLVLALIGGALAAAICAPAAQAAPWLKLDRVEVEPSVFPETVRLRVFVSAITLQGETIPLFGTKAWQLQLSGTKRSIPHLAGRYRGVDS